MFKSTAFIEWNVNPGPVWTCEFDYCVDLIPGRNVLGDDIFWLAAYAQENKERPDWGPKGGCRIVFRDKNKQIAVQADDGKTIRTVGNGTFCDGNWHRIKVQYDTDTVVVSLDNRVLTRVSDASWDVTRPFITIGGNSNDANSDHRVRNLFVDGTSVSTSRDMSEKTQMVIRCVPSEKDDIAPRTLLGSAQVLPNYVRLASAGRVEKGIVSWNVGAGSTFMLDFWYRIIPLKRNVYGNDAFWCVVYGQPNSASPDWGPRSGCRIRIEDQSKRLIIQNMAGQDIVNEDASRLFDQNWHDITVSFVPRTVTVTLDKRVSYSVTDKNYDWKGPLVGLGAYHVDAMSHHDIRNVELTKQNFD